MALQNSKNWNRVVLMAAISVLETESHLGWDVRGWYVLFVIASMRYCSSPLWGTLYLESLDIRIEVLGISQYNKLRCLRVLQMWDFTLIEHNLAATWADERNSSSILCQCHLAKSSIWVSALHGLGMCCDVKRSH